mmetsp:Transcript_15598/g.37420  ORF Transcript_15598/g.37420 Transcript_15598/m.37420 type:complete len:480 (+) Transcript_15598:334-1773(+)
MLEAQGRPIPSADVAPCRVYLHEPAAAASYSIPPRYTPKAWRYNKYSQELWLREALRAAHPWRVSSPAEADLIVVGTDFSMLCEAHKLTAARYLWQIVLNDTLLCNGTRKGRQLVESQGDAHCASAMAPKLLPLTSVECGLPWRGWANGWAPPSKPPRDFLFLLDHHALKLDPRRMIVSPAVVARPAWLLEPASPPLVAWSSRPLLFFAGHIPKLFVSRSRYRIWEQLVGVPNVTSLSSTLPCTVGAFEVCAAQHAWTERVHETFCEANGWQCRSRDPGPPCGVKNKEALRHKCKAYRRLNWTAIVPAIRHGRTLLAREEYFRVAQAHRFCLVAPGDFISTPKVSEFALVGATGGCIPVIVVPDKVDLEHGARAMLPLSGSLEYCDLAFLVPLSVATASMHTVLSHLSRVTPNEAARKHEALRRAQDAFAWRDSSSGPSAVDHILSAACAAARELRGGLPSDNLARKAASLRRRDCVLS